MTTTDKLTDEQWLIQHLKDDAEACSAVNGSKDITTKDARRAEVTVKRLIRERDDARRASQAAPAPSDGLQKLLNEALIKQENDSTLWTPEWQMWAIDARAALSAPTEGEA